MRRHKWGLGYSLRGSKACHPNRRPASLEKLKICKRDDIVPMHFNKGLGVKKPAPVKKPRASTDSSSRESVRRSVFRAACKRLNLEPSFSNWAGKECNANCNQDSAAAKQTANGNE